MPSNPVFQAFGEPVEILVSSKATRYAFCTNVQTSPPGGGPPPHRHAREDELFWVLDGDFEFFDGRAWRRFGKDEVKYSLRGYVHGFRNCGAGPGRMLFTAIGGGLDEYLALLSALSLPQDLAQLTEISQLCGIEFAAPAPP